MCVLQEVEEVWSRLGTDDNIPLKKTAFSMTIKGITRCIFDDSFEDQALVDKVSAAYMSAWGEMEVLYMPYRAKFLRSAIFTVPDKSAEKKRKLCASKIWLYIILWCMSLHKSKQNNIMIVE